MIRAIRNFLKVGIGIGIGYVSKSVDNLFPFLALEASEYTNDGLAHARQRVLQGRFRQFDAMLTSDFEANECIGVLDVTEHINEEGI